MLSRAARNAYSWWWASHIRTKQSKWLDQNLLDMEEKVEYILKIITEDGDSFRVRAEQYYEKRPEIVNFVEDSFRGYRALAERYDHLSKDLQSANRTIAMVFPERVHMPFDDEEEYEDFASSFDEYENMVPVNAHIPLPPKQKQKKQELPKMENVVVQAMVKKKSKMRTKMMSKKGLLKIGVDDENASKVSKSSGLSKDEANNEIDKLQKDILEFQTEKEFVKSSYENALSKYREIENNINEMHTKISHLQHEFAVGEAMGDQAAQTLMSTSALNMCKETIDKLKHKQKRFKTEAVMEHNRVNDLRKKFEALIEARDCNDIDSKNLDKKEKSEENIELKSCEENGALLVLQEEIDHLGLVKTQETRKCQDKKDSENIEDQKAMTKDDEIHRRTIGEITISEVADKIEQLVAKVITLETDLASQTALVIRLRFEIDELHEHVQSLEQENCNLVDESNNKNIKIKKLEEELERVQMLDKKIEVQNVQMETSLDKASVSLDNLSNDLLIAKPDDQNTQEEDVIFKPEKDQESRKFQRIEEKEKENRRKDSNDDLEGFVNKKPNDKDEGDQHLKFIKSEVIIKDQDVHCNGEEDKPNWSLILTHGIEDRERMLLEEYTSTLKNFKEIKHKLNETEKKNRVTSFKSAVQMKMLRSSNDSKDDEIRSLHEKLKKLEAKIDFQVKKSLERKELDTITENGLFVKGSEMIDIEGAQDWIPADGTESEFEVDEATEVELTKASNAIDEGTNRITELVENAHYELQKARDLIKAGTQERKKTDETVECEPMKSTDLVDEGRQRSKELNETTDFELRKASNSVDEIKHTSKEVDETTDFEQNRAPNSADEEVDEITDQELMKKTPDLMAKGTVRRKERVGDVGEAPESLEIEEEIRVEIEDLRKENLEIWLRFSTSYHQINRFQDSFYDLLQEIKQVKEKKPEHGSGKQRHHRAAYASDIRPLYRHLQDMQTEIVLWQEKSGILEDDLQHRLKSLSDIQNELSNLTNDDVSESETTTTTTMKRNNYQAVQFQGEVLNMKQENIKVIQELREASERVRMLQIDIDKTLSKLDEELGEINKWHSRSRVAFKSILFGSKLRKKHKHSLFTYMTPSLQRQYSNLQELPQPGENS